MAFIYNELNSTLVGDTWTKPINDPNPNPPGGFRSGPITITQDATILSSTGDALALNGGLYTLTVNGTVSSKAAGLFSGIALLAAVPVGTSKITVSTTGDVHGVLDGIYSNHSVNITNAGMIAGNNAIRLFDGTVAETITNTGIIWSVDNTQAINATSTGLITVNNSGEIYGNVWLNTGAHKVTNSGLIAGAVDLDNGVDTVTNSGEIDGVVLTRAGNDIVTNSGDIYNIVDLGDDHDKLVNSGTIHGNGVDPVAVWFGNGIDTMTNSGMIFGVVNAGDGNDIFTNSGTIDNQDTLFATVFMGADNDTLTNSGTIINDVGMGDGNDTFNNTGKVTGWTLMGLGDDKFTGGKNVDRVVDEVGVDTYILGDGWDVFWAANVLGAANGIDKVDGGLNTGTNPILGKFGDEYNASESTASVYINADLVNRTTEELPGLILTKLQATGTEIGTDNISNFEIFVGGTNADVIFGNASANEIWGNLGSDSLHGGAGRDTIRGGDGEDIIFGDAGRDILHGNAGVDTFSYHALTESTSGLSGRDLIVDFQDDADIISFDYINIANLHWQGVDELFAGGGLAGAGAGAIRALTTAGGWTIQVDVNGDKKIDMAIDVIDTAHAIIWSASDFEF